MASDEINPAVAEVDARWMARALQLADRAAEQDEVPVGAVLLDADGELIGEGSNAPIANDDASAHAEIMALRAAGKATGNYRLPGSTLYVTIEPCAMCAGALVHARVARVVFGADEPRAGAVRSQMRFFDQPFLNHHVRWQGGVKAACCTKKMADFFEEKRR